MDINPALMAAQVAQKNVEVCLDSNKSFRLEAGAGAGKTYSLIAALKRIISLQGQSLIHSGQKVACITYTEVARDEISREIEEHPAILVETIHAFSWKFLSPFQKSLRALVEELEDRRDKIEEGGGVGLKPVEYNFGYFGVDSDHITLSHDDVPLFMAKLLAQDKYRKLLSHQFPFIFIDEYQDTDKNFMNALAEYFFKTKEGSLIGLFGDHWQTIYRGDYELINLDVETIEKGANFRSASSIVKVLNRLRPELPQQISSSEVGEARFFYTNSYSGERTNTAHSKNDLPSDIAKLYREKLIQNLTTEGWDFNKTKILMLTHNALAADQGYPQIAEIFPYKESFVKKEDVTLKFLCETVEPMFFAYTNCKYGDMFNFLGNTPIIRSHGDKITWRKSMDALNALRQKATIGDVIDHLKTSKCPQIPDKVMKLESDLKALNDSAIPDEQTSLARYVKLRSIPYIQVIELTKFVDGNTPFATQHSVKGAEFENVLVVLGGGWNHYNWPTFFDLLNTRALTDKNTKGFYRARNLFYVSISRPMKRLAVLATQTMSDTALSSIDHLFESKNIENLVL